MSILTLDHLLRLAEPAARADPDIARRLRLWAADCAARVLHIYETAVPGDDRVRRAIVATRGFARSEIDAAFVVAALVAAEAAAGAAGRNAAGAAASASVSSSRWVSDWAAAGKAGRSAVPSDARAAEEAWQLDRLIAWMSDPEPTDWPLDAAETTTTTTTAAA